MLKKVTKIALVGIIGLGGLGLTNGVSAATVAEYDTKANIKFLTREEIIETVDPEYPDENIKPDMDPNGGDVILPGTSGPLSIDYASHINFGNVKISGSAKTYYADSIKFTDDELTERAPYVQVTDDRGAGTGWKLEVSQAAQFSMDGAKPLSGAQLSLENGEVNTIGPVGEVTPTAVTFDNFNQLYPVMTATTGNGLGTYTNQFGKILDGKAKDVSLYIPSHEIIETGQKYSAELNWKLSDTP